MPSAFQQRATLLEFSRCASFDQLFQCGLGISLGHAFLSCLRSTVKPVLVFFQAQTSNGANHLDRVYLVVTSRLQDHAEFGLFSGSTASSSTASSSWSSHRSSRNTELLFNRLYQLIEFQHGHVVQSSQKCVFIECHFVFLTLKN